MARSHICPRCGQELAGTPARLGAGVAQPLVVCPRCGSGWARTTRATRRATRDAALTARAALALSLQLSGAIALSLLTGGFAFALSRFAAFDPREAPLFAIETSPDFLGDAGRFDSTVLVVFGLRFYALSVVVLALASGGAAAWSAVWCAHRSTLAAWRDWLCFSLAGLGAITAFNTSFEFAAGRFAQETISSSHFLAVFVSVALVFVSSLLVLASHPLRGPIRRLLHASTRRKRINTLRRARAIRRPFA